MATNEDRTPLPRNHHNIVIQINKLQPVHA